jgi:hypothetical protein
MQSFFDLTYDHRFRVYDAINAAGCQQYPGGGSGLLSVAVAKGKFGELTHALETLGMKQIDLYKFPLGSDNPPDHLRHESHGIANSCWLIANFRPH